MGNYNNKRKYFSKESIIQDKSESKISQSLPISIDSTHPSLNNPNFIPIYKISNQNESLSNNYIPTDNKELGELANMDLGTILISFDTPDIREQSSVLNSIMSRTEQDVPGFSFHYTDNCDFVTDTKCCICFIDYYDGIIMHMLPCDHILHKDCISDWYKKSPSCPLCRHEI
jgi:hypothetical protein